MKTAPLLASLFLLTCNSASADLIAYWNLNSTTGLDGSGRVISTTPAVVADDGSSSVSATLDFVVGNANQLEVLTTYGTTENALNSDVAGLGYRLGERIDKNWELHFNGLDFSNRTDVEMSYAQRAADADPNFGYNLDYNLNDGNGWQSGITYSFDPSTTTSFATVTHDLSSITAIEGQSNVSLRFDFTSMDNNKDVVVDNFQIIAVPEPSTFTLIALAGLSGVSRIRGFRRG